MCDIGQNIFVILCPRTTIFPPQLSDWLIDWFHLRKMASMCKLICIVILWIWTNQRPHICWLCKIGSFAYWSGLMYSEVCACALSLTWFLSLAIGQIFIWDTVISLLIIQRKPPFRAPVLKHLWTPNLICMFGTEIWNFDFWTKKRWVRF